MIRITGGTHRSRRLHTPPDETRTRPYAQRAREAVFNLLRGWFEDANVLDLFAGIGTMGLEAASRGARRVTLVERDRKVFELLEANVAALGCADQVTAVCGDALGQAALLRAPAPVDVVFLDPPYAMMRDETGRQRVLDQAARCARIMAPRSFLVLRSPTGPSDWDLEVEGLDGPEAHRYASDMWVLLYAPPIEPADETPDDPASNPSTMNP